MSVLPRHRQPARSEVRLARASDSSRELELSAVYFAASPHPVPIIGVVLYIAINLKSVFKSNHHNY